MALCIRHLTKRFGETVALEDVSFDVFPSQLVAVCGPSGSGKTTLLRVISGLEKQASGHIQLCEQVIDGWEPHRRGMAYVAQDSPALPHLSVEENIAFPLRQLRQSARQIAEKVGDAATKLGIQALLPRKPHEISAGERARLALARAIVRSPNALLLDEPLAHLDPVLRRSMRDVLREVHRHVGQPTILVTHHVEEAFALADQMVVLAGGRVRQIGAPEEIYGSPADLGVARLSSLHGLNTFAGIWQKGPDPSPHSAKDREGARLVLPRFQFRLAGCNDQLAGRDDQKSIPSAVKDFSSHVFSWFEEREPLRQQGSEIDMRVLAFRPEDVRIGDEATGLQLGALGIDWLPERSDFLADRRMVRLRSPQGHVIDWLTDVNVSDLSSGLLYCPAQRVMTFPNTL